MVNLLCIGWGTVSSIGTLLVAIIAAIIAFIQYKSESSAAKEATRSKILEDYNWHYMQNSSIKRVVKSLIDDNFEDSQIHKYDLEIFMRFFEEIYLLIHSKNRMKAEVAKYMFSYYAIMAWTSEKFWQKLCNDDINEIEIERNSEHWFIFRKFVEEMRNISNKHDINI